MHGITKADLIKLNGYCLTSAISGGSNQYRDEPRRLHPAEKARLEACNHQLPRSGVSNFRNRLVIGSAVRLNFIVGLNLPPVRSNKPCDSILSLTSTMPPTPILSLNSSSLQ
ncbi:hypothetical protein ACFE04_019338 [Oxalis oulophora]